MDNAEREIHLRSVALVRHFARGDHSAVNLLLPDIMANRDTSWRQIVSLVGLCQAQTSGISWLSRHRCGSDLAMRTVEGLVERGFRDTP